MKNKKKTQIKGKFTFYDLFSLQRPHILIHSYSSYGWEMEDGSADFQFLPLRFILLKN